MDPVVERVAALAVGLGRRAAGNRPPLASQLAPPTLGAALRTQPRRPSTAGSRPSEVDRADGLCQSALGAPRIHGELRKLGIQVSERTVSRMLARLSRPPSQGWRTFLANHVAAVASMDFFTVSTLAGRLLFVFVILSHNRRRILHVNCAERPTSAWAAQQLVEAFPEDIAPRWLLRDRDNIYDEQVRRRIASLGITEVVSSPRSPWQNPYVERVIGCLRRECLNHVIVFNERHLRRILRAYLPYYHRTRTHLALDKDAPDGRRASSGSGTIIVTPEVGGLHHRYDRQAA